MSPLNTKEGNVSILTSKYNGTVCCMFFHVSSLISVLKTLSVPLKKALHLSSFISEYYFLASHKQTFKKKKKENMMSESFYGTVDFRKYSVTGKTMRQKMHTERNGCLYHAREIYCLNHYTFMTDGHRQRWRRIFRETFGRWIDTEHKRFTQRSWWGIQRNCTGIRTQINGNLHSKANPVIIQHYVTRTHVWKG